jgi:DNA-binding MarR family transcriptional regulator
MSRPDDASMLLSLTLRLMRIVKIAFATGVDGECVSPAQYRMLERLRRGHATVSDLAQWQAVTPPTATRVLDGLVERGWAQRWRSEDDRRQVYVCLTDAGARALAVLEERARTALGGVLARMTPGQLEKVRLAMPAIDAVIPEASESTTVG